jgi:hypothetical protein
MTLDSSKLGAKVFIALVEKVAIASYDQEARTSRRCGRLRWLLQRAREQHLDLWLAAPTHLHFGKRPQPRPNATRNAGNWRSLLIHQGGTYSNIEKAQPSSR